MARFAYHAVDPTGAERRGRLDAANENEAQRSLGEKGWLVITLAPAGDAAQTAGQPAARRVGWRSPRLSAKQLALFTRQLASLMLVTPLEEALRTISRQNERPAVRSVLGNVHAGIVEGLPLAEAMAREERSFAPIYRAMIAAGEQSGSLPTLANRLADLLEKQAAVRSKIIAALAYPLVLTLVAVVVVSGLMISVVPRVVEQFDNAARQLPLLTRVVINVSSFLAAYWWALLLALGLIAWLGWRLLQNDAIRLRFDGWLLRLPFIGRLIRDIHAATFARTLSTMIESRLPLVDGIRLTARTVRNRVQRAALVDIGERLRGGESLSGAMRATASFPPLLVYLASSGEAAGQLGPMLGRAADYLEREFDSFTTAAMALLEPAIIVIMGVVVATIILAILLPILQLQNLTGI